jgi:hypothetical protein
VRARLDGPSAGRLSPFVIGMDRAAEPEGVGTDPGEPVVAPPG